MISKFNKPRKSIIPRSSSIKDETYDLRGLNMVAPDQVMPTGETPFAINNRMYAKQDGKSRVTSQTRQGSDTYSIPVGSAVDVSDDTATDVTYEVTNSQWLAQQFTANTSGVLTQVILRVKNSKASVQDLWVEIYSDNSNAPGNSIAQSSIPTSDIESTFDLFPVYFMDAPAVTSSEKYWIVVHGDIDFISTYTLAQSDSLTNSLKQSINGGATWKSFGEDVEKSICFKTYISTAGKPKGFFRYAPSSKDYLNILAQNNDVYKIDDASFTPISISSGVSSDVTKVRFAQINDDLYWVDGQAQAQVYNATNGASNVPNLGGAPRMVLAHKNYLFFMKGNTRMEFSELGDYDTYPSVNYWYIPSPNTDDEVTGWIEFQNYMLIFTRLTKYIFTIENVPGSQGVATAALRHMAGSRGAISQECISADSNYAYFISDDHQLYRFNGVSDELLSSKVEPEITSMFNDNDTSLSVIDNFIRVYYRKLPSSSVNSMLLYDIIEKQWFMDTGREIQQSYKIPDTSIILETSSKAGWLLRTSKKYSDMGKAIDFKYWTPYKSYLSNSMKGGGTSKKRIKKFHPILRVVENDYVMFIGRDFDFSNSPDMRAYQVSSSGAKWGGGGTWGSDSTEPIIWGAKKYVDNPTPMNSRGKHIQFRFEKKGINTPVEIYGYIAIIKIGKAE